MLSGPPLSSSTSGTVQGAAGSVHRPIVLLHVTPPFFKGFEAFLIQVAAAAGAEVEIAAAPLASGELADRRLLVVLNVLEPLAPDVVAAVHAFVRGGDSLLVVVDEDHRNPRTREIHDPLIAPFGLGFTEDLSYVHNVGAVAEPGVINRERRELPYSGGRAVTGGTPFSFVLDTEQEAHAAWAEIPGGGRVIAMGEAMAALGLGQKEGERLSGVPRDPSRTTYWGKDARVFMEEVFAWLLRTPPAR